MNKKVIMNYTIKGKILPNIKLNNDVFFENIDLIKTYNSVLFSINYLEKWRVDITDEFTQFYPTEDYGAITISTYSQVKNTDINSICKFIIKLSNQEDDLNQVVVTNNNIKEFYYEYTENLNQWIIKVFSVNDKLFVLTINCLLSRWNEKKDIFFKTINSFSIQNNNTY